MNERYCRCGHTVLLHRADLAVEGAIDWVARSAAQRPGLSGVKFGPFHCHGDRCACRLFTEDRSLWNQFKRWWRR